MYVLVEIVKRILNVKNSKASYKGHLTSRVKTCKDNICTY